MAYVMQKSPYVFPIVGGRKLKHLKANVEALSLNLTAEDIREVEGAVAFDIGFLLNLLSGPGDARGPGDVGLNKDLGCFDWIEVCRYVLLSQ